MSQSMNEGQLGHEKVHLPDTWRGEMKALLVLGVPMALTQLGQFFVYTIDILMVGRLGPLDLAAASLGSVVYFFLLMLGIGPVMAVSPLVSQALGADQDAYHDVRVSVRMALWVVLGITPIMLGVVMLSEPLSIWAGQDPLQAQKAGQYVLALAGGWPFLLMSMVLRNFLAALGKTKIPLVLVLATTAINAGLNALLIFGMFGFPRLGLVGAGIASSLSYICGFFMFVIYIWLDKRASQFHVFHHFFKPHWDRFRDVAKLGWPISLTTVFEGMLFNACIFLVGLIGINEVAAYQIALNVAALAFMVPWGLSMAGAVRVGLAKGAGNLAAVKRAGLASICLSVAGILVFAIPVLLFPDVIAALYLDTNQAENQVVIALVTSFIPIAAAFMVFDAVQVAANQNLRGLKDVNWPMVLTGISYWIIGFPTAYWLSQKTTLGAQGVWYGLLIGLFAASILLSARFWVLLWKKEQR